MEIHNLDGLIRLEKLQLDNNVIGKIEGLDHLVNLKWLDLSFNNITRMEGLGNLVNLTDLSLFQNKISKVEGMDKLTKLNYFSIGNNEITTTDTLYYLQRFRSLQVLIVDGNPFCKNDTDNEVKHSVIAMLPQLKYLNYMMIDDETMKTAKTNNAAEHQKAEQALQARTELSKENVLQELEEANIAKIDNYAEQLKDPEMKKLEPMQKQNELWSKFEEELKEITNTFQELMKAHARERKEAMEVCDNLMKDEEKEAEKKTVACIDEFRRNKKHMYRDFKDGKAPITSLDSLKKGLKQLDADLMHTEMEHFDLVWNQANNKFSSTIENITNAMVKKNNDLYISPHNATRIAERISAASTRSTTASSKNSATTSSTTSTPRSTRKLVPRTKTRRTRS